MLEQIKKSYSPRDRIPLEGYAAITAAFGVLMLGAFRSVNLRQKKPLSEGEILKLGISAHKLSRIISKDAVMSFLRAPFTRYEDDLGYGEIQESARGKGLKRVISELMSCNYCLSIWAGMGLVWGNARFPRLTRNFTNLLTMTAISDFLHVFYEERRTHANVLTLQEEKIEKKAS